MRSVVVASHWQQRGRSYMHDKEAHSGSLSCNKHDLRAAVVAGCE